MVLRTLRVQLLPPLVDYAKDDGEDVHPSPPRGAAIGLQVCVLQSIDIAKGAGGL